MCVCERERVAKIFPFMPSHKGVVGQEVYEMEKRTRTPRGSLFLVFPRPKCCGGGGSEKKKSAKTFIIKYPKNKFSTLV